MSEIAENQRSARSTDEIILAMSGLVLHSRSTMKRTTIRDFRNHYSRVLKWVAAGEEVEVTRRGIVVAKVIPAAPSTKRVAWAKSAAWNRPLWSKPLTDRQRDAVLAESQGI